jgi:hypothetical protein
MMLAAFSEIPKSIMMLRNGYQAAYYLGAFVGIVLLSGFGFFIFRDGMRVGGRIRSKAATSSGPIDPR